MVDFPVDAYYNFRGAIDNLGQAWIDGQQLADINGQTKEYNSTKFITAGRKALRITGRNTGGPKAAAFVIEGSIKISRENENGEELLLYYMEGGDTCAMSLQCCTRKVDSQIKATSMEPSLLLMFPSENMERWLDHYKSWRQFILNSYHSRMIELMESIDAIAFMNLDQRLLKYLSDQAKILGSLEINHTHQQVADDLHSSRVVISRLLKQLETKGEIQLLRNKIILKKF
jgi:CRP/FNR family transcriptional regulator